MNLVFIPRPGGRDALETDSQPKWLLIALFAIGSSGGGAILGFALSLVGGLIRDASMPAWLAVAGIVAATGLAADAFGFTERLPQRPRQVPREWLARKRAIDYAFLYGVMLGAGFFTYLIVGSIYALAALLLVAPSTTAAGLLGAIYGLARAAPLLIDALRGRRADAATAIDSMSRQARFATLLAGAIAVAGSTIQSGVF